MTFTSNPPSRPGFYAWKDDDESDFAGIERKVFLHQQELCVKTDKGIFTVIEFGGLWCPLFPADELEKAFREGESMGKWREPEQSWLQSNTRKLVEGI